MRPSQNALVRPRMRLIGAENSKLEQFNEAVMIVMHNSCGDSSFQDVIPASSSRLDGQHSLHGRPVGVCAGTRTHDP